MHWLNTLHPVALDVAGPLQIRWYGLAYVAGFACAYLFMRALVRRGMGVLKEAELADFVTYTALFGVMLGGRLGYMLLYTPAEFFGNPLSFFQITKGGMASHGGILGIVIFTWFYARKKKVSWTGLGDMLVVPAPLGIFFGRLANFINGELWGHESNVPWAVKFPQEAAENPALIQQGHALGYDLSGGPGFIDAIRADTGLRQWLTEVLPSRHPSQLYEALLEGLLLFIILAVVRWRWKDLRHGVLTGIFFIGYALLRIIGEHWRVPDLGAELWPFGMSPGQRYSAVMIVMGIVFLVTSLRKRKEIALTA